MAKDSSSDVLPRAPTDSADIQAISDWLIGRGLVASDFEATITGFCERLLDAGVPLMRGMMAMRTLHPTIDAVSFVWRDGQGTEGIAMGIDAVGSEEWLQSPLYHLMSSDQRVLRRRLTGPDATLDYPILHDLRELGATEYYALLIPFDIGPGGNLDTGLLSSWVTAAPDGFSEGHIRILDRLIPRLALSVNANLTKQIAVNVLDTYVGPDAGRRIMGGEIHRSEMQVIRAVMLYADLRSFTALADTLPGTELIDMLDGYYDRLVPAVVSHGGQVLKFLGDGLLATFDLEEQPRDAICKHALAAASEAVAAVDALNAEREKERQPIMKLDIALHLGDVFYGNIGADTRLDFTVIGPAVNEATRIEALCDPLNRSILVSETFARAATACTDYLVPLGRHKLRGVRDLQELYGVEAPGAA